MKRLPRLKTDKAAEDFGANADLTKYDLSKMRLVQFEFKPIVSYYETGNWR
jgi:hypothetical protein